MQSGLYVHAFDISDFVRQLATRLGIADSVASFATRSIAVGTNLDDRAMVARCWPLDDLANRTGSSRTNSPPTARN